MQSENRLERKTLYKDNSQVIEDHQDSSDNDILFNTISLGLAAVAGYGLYKSGALRPITKSLLEFANNVAKSGGDYTANVAGTVKQWIYLSKDSSEHITPKNSIFRERDASLGYSIFEDISNMAKSNTQSLVNARNIINDTARDMQLLQEMIKQNQEKGVNRENYLDTKMFFYMNEHIHLKSNLFQNYGRHEALILSDKAMSDFIKKMTLTAEKAQQELHETGYRKLVLGDVAEIAEDEYGHRLVMKKDSPINIESIANEKGVSLLEAANEFFKNNTFNGNKTILSSGAWKDLVIDSSIRIDEKGSIIDYRMSKNNLIDFAHSLANDFGLPLVKFSPGQMLGLDKVGRKKPLAGIIAAEQFSPSLTGVAGKVKVGDWLGDTFGEFYRGKNVTVIDGVAYVVDENNKLKEIARNLKLHDVTNADKRQGLKPLHNASRQMGGISTGTPPDLSPEEIAKLTPSQRAKYNAGKFFDLGRHEIRPDGSYNDTSFDTMMSPETWTDEGISKIFGIKPLWVNGFGFETRNDYYNSFRTDNFKTMFGQGLPEYSTGSGNVITPRVYDVTREGFKIKNIITDLKNNNTDEAIEELKGFGMQFFVGQNKDGTMHKYHTERSGIFFTVFNQLDEGLAGAAKPLGLSINSKKTPFGVLKNLLLKRALPVFLLSRVPGMINYFSEPFFGGEDENGNRDNIGKFLMREVVKPIDIGAHHAMDLIGATKVFKFLGEMVPGSDQINEIPGIYQLGLGQSKEEREEYIENGYDPMRKGRYWGSGNTPFTGGKIMYFRPNIYRRVEADVEFSDSKWGSRQEYYNNTWYPNPVNPLAPLNHFIFDKHHYDKKHYYDRPYLQTSPAGENIPVIGPLYSSTIGKIVSPPRKMHKEYWENGLEINPADELPHSLLTTGESYDNSAEDFKIHNDIQEQVESSKDSYYSGLYSSAYQAKQVISRSYIEKSGITFEEKNILPERTFKSEKYDTPYEAYSTPSGALTIVDVPDEMNLYDVNKDLRHYSINKVIGTNQRVTMIDDFQGPDIPVGNDSPSVDNAFIYGLGEQFNTLADVAGLKGFAMQAFVTGEANEKARVIEDSGYAYSFNKSFWDENLGGLGGSLSEITRRFIPKRNNKVEYVNPIRNTMPSWMPGSNYFTDFKHGDPYSKIDNGEERLPGEGYERLHGINGIGNLSVDTSTLGYEKNEIVKRMLHSDRYISSLEKSNSSADRQLIGDIQSAWSESGLAFDVRGKIEDKRNSIHGSYDARVRDLTSPTGMSIVDIQPVSSEELKNIRLTGNALPHHVNQTNYSLWATGNQKSKGYIYYVDRNNPDDTHTVSIKFSRRALKNTLKNVYEARKEIRGAMESGELGRGELYSPMDRFRILADVAPYSQEFRDASSELSMMNLSAEEEREKSKILDRVKQQKEPLRVYDYKFRTANLKKETVTVTKVLDNNTFLTEEYGTEHAIKFAGIHVSEDNTTLYNPKEIKYKGLNGRKKTHKFGKTMNEAAAREIHKHIKPGARVSISYDADEHNKFSKDSVESIRAVVKSGGVNVNKNLLNRGLATEKENDNSPAAIRARYTSGEIAFGSAMETATHDIIGRIPFVGSKIMQVRSPYEQYRRREVYGKDFQSWNHPIRDILVPHIQSNIANNDLLGIGGIIGGAFMGSMFGKTPYGKVVGAVVGGVVPAAGKLVFALGSDKERDWRPKRRREQEKLNEYVDTLKYVKNMKLYEQYKIKAKKENNFDVEKFIESKDAEGAKNKLKRQELMDYKKKVKLDFKHRDRYNFKYGNPKYVEDSMDKKSTVRAINKEISELQSNRKVDKLPENALKAIKYKQAAEQTMYGYEPGDSLVDIMSALPKKERQYFKHFVDAPEEEKKKILRIAPSYLRRALQSSWGMPVDKKPSLDEYFRTHGLPDASWIGWDENTNIDDIKVKLVHQNKLDPGEFDIWDADKAQADQVNIPIPKINAKNNPREVQIKLSQILGSAGYENVQISFAEANSGNKTIFHVKKDAKDDVAQQIEELEV